jgi:hypothetical protein
MTHVPFAECQYADVDRRRIQGVGLDPDDPIAPEVTDNLRVFSRFGRDTLANLRTMAYSPFDGETVEPLAHFGVDSDPWMHAILYCDGSGRHFIIICLGLTYDSVLGGVYLPESRLVLENLDSWYYPEIFRTHMVWNLPRILSYFNHYLAEKTPSRPPASEIVLALGNNRLGDYLMQLNWLSDVVEHQSDFVSSVTRVLVNRQSNFFEPGRLFPEISGRIVELESRGHIEHSIREGHPTLISSGLPLSDPVGTPLLKRRLQRYASGEIAAGRAPADFSLLQSCALTIWISFELEKRVWVEQIEGLTEILSRFAKAHLRGSETLGLVVNGMTGVERGKPSRVVRGMLPRERELVRSIADALDVPVVIVNLSGRSLREKTPFASQVGFVLAPVGPASLIPSLFFDRPGLVYGNLVDDLRSNAGPATVRLDKSLVADVPAVKGTIDWENSQCVSYSIRWEEILAELDRRFVFNRQAGEGGDRLVAQPKDVRSS